MVVPGGLILHNRGTAALDGVGDDQRRLSLADLRRVVGRHKGPGIAAVHIDHIPAEAFKPRPDVVLVHDLLRGTGDLEPVPVYGGAEIVQPELTGRHGRLPDRALGQLAVAHYRIDPVGPPIPFSGQRHSNAVRESVAQGPGAHFDTRQGVVGMADKFGTEFGVGPLDLLQIQKPLVAEHRVKGLYAVPLAEHESVPVRIVDGFRRNAHPVIEDRQQIDHAHIPADVPALARHHNIQNVQPKPPCFLF